MNVPDSKKYESASVQGVSFHIKRISLAARLRFLAEQGDALQRVNYLVSQADPVAARERAETEIGLSKALLRLCLIGISDDVRNANDLADWLVEDAPKSLCSEILEAASNEMSLTEQKRKN